MIGRRELKMTTNDLKYVRKALSLANFVLSIAKKSDLIIRLFNCNSTSILLHTMHLH